MDMTETLLSDNPSFTEKLRRFAERTPELKKRRRDFLLSAEEAVSLGTSDLKRRSLAMRLIARAYDFAFYAGKKREEAPIPPKRMKEHDRERTRSYGH